MNPLFAALIAKALEIVAQFIPDPNKKAELQLQLLQLQQSTEFKQLDAMVQLAQTQTDTNKVEAASPNLFIAGWRPAVGWVCVTAFGINFVVAPLATWGAALAGHPVQFPSLDISQMMPVLLGMLGLGALRTVEKVQGAQGNH